MTLVHALGAKPRAQKADLIAQTQTLLAAEEHERRRRVVFIIDEAHLPAPDQLEELRLLTNAEMDSQSPFALVLVGQPTLARQLRLGVFAALDERIATRCQLAPMDLAEAAQYLRHRLALVGRADPLFADDAIARLHKVSLGLPRALNNAAIAALIAAATAGKALVDDDCAKKAVAELTRHWTQFPKHRATGWPSHNLEEVEPLLMPVYFGGYSLTPRGVARELDDGPYPLREGLTLAPARQRRWVSQHGPVRTRGGPGPPPARPLIDNAYLKYPPDPRKVFTEPPANRGEFTVFPGLHPARRPYSTRTRPGGRSIDSSMRRRGLSSSRIACESGPCASVPGSVSYWRRPRQHAAAIPALERE